MRPAEFEIVEDKPGKPLVIRDVGPWNKHGTITNDAEGVVQRLHEAGKLPGNRRLLYYDSEGELDELVHENGTFVGFSPGPR